METPSYISVAVELNYGLWPAFGRHQNTSEDDWKLILKGLKGFNKNTFSWKTYNQLALRTIERHETFALDCLTPLYNYFNRIQILPDLTEGDSDIEELTRHHLTLLCQHIKTAIREWNASKNTYKGFSLLEWTVYRNTNKTFWKYIADTIIEYAKNNPTHISITLNNEEDSD